MNTPLIAGNSDRMMAKTISSQDQNIDKVQRLERNFVASSEAKWGAPRNGEEIVSSTWKHVAAKAVTVSRAVAKILGSITYYLERRMVTSVRQPFALVRLRSTATASS